jgi:O-antigen/teichoic acid export membrane protein/aminoglycoside phosphotransferase (APT) family kinase protein
VSAAAERLRAQLRVPLFRDGYALVLNSGLTALMGAVYWLLAAHEFSARTLGINSAALSATMFLAGVSQLNLMSALLRFVPVSGAAARRLVVSSYGVSVALGVVTATVFIAGVTRWAPNLGFLQQPAFVAWFLAATAAWCVFNLQDSVLTGVGRAVLVPVENQIFSTAKIVLLLALATASPRYGIFASWTAALVLSLVPVNLLVFMRLLPAHARADGRHARPPSRAQLARYVSADCLASLFWLAATSLMPVIVLAFVGATPTAWFSMAWMIAMPLFLMSINGGAALVVAGAREEHRLDQYARQALRQTLRMVVPAALALAVAAPLVLRLFGAQYAAGATTTLRLLSLAAIPNAVVALAVSARRVRRDMRAVVLLTASQCGLVLAVGVALLRHGSIAGVGAAWLVASTLVAGAVVAIDAGGVRRLGWIRATPAYRRRTRRAVAMAPEILQCLEAQAGERRWTVHGSLRTVSDMAVLTIGPAGEASRAVIKVATSETAARSLERERDALAALHGDVRLGTWRHLLPDVIAHGACAGAPYLVERLMPGRTGTQALGRSRAPAGLTAGVAAAIAPLHRATAVETRAGPVSIQRWVEAPLDTVGRHGGGRLPARARERLAGELCDALADRRLAVSWIHGDFVPGNILVDPTVAARVTGIVDWELARPDDLPLVDVATVLLAARMQTSRRELGRVVCDFLSAGHWTPDEQGVVDEACAGLPGEAVDARALVLLCWLRHVSANLAKASSYASHERWLRGNVAPVADALVRS